MSRSQTAILLARFHRKKKLDMRQFGVNELNHQNCPKTHFVRVFFSDHQIRPQNWPQWLGTKSRIVRFLKPMYNWAVGRFNFFDKWHIVGLKWKGHMFTSALEFLTNWMKLTIFTILASEALLHENKKESSNKMLPPVRIEPGTSDSKSNTFLSVLTWHLPIRLRL